MNNDKFRFYTLDDIPHFKILGRNVADAGRNGKPLALFWTASGIECRVRAGELWMDMESLYDIYEPWISVRVNGTQIARFMITEGKHRVCLYRGFPPDTVNDVQVLKETQPMPADPAHCLLIYGFAADSTVEFLKVPEKSLKLEFVGDSITTGEGLGGAVREMDWISACMATDCNYARLTAQKLDADFRIVSQSGWGVVSGWDNNVNSVIPRYYDQICGLVPGDLYEKLGAHARYDFSVWKPDAVVINLGTNDSGAFTNPPWTDPVTGISYKQRTDVSGKPISEDSAHFMEVVSAFIRHVRACNPQAFIMWVWGMCPMILGDYIEEAVCTYKNKCRDDRVMCMKLPCMSDETEEEKGSRQHPGPGTHRRTAELISEKLKAVLKL